MHYFLFPFVKVRNPKNKIEQPNYSQLNEEIAEPCN
jgi:hypothetical protein